MNTPGPERWVDIWRKVTAAGDPQPLYRELVGRYSEPERHYHNFIHIGECLAEFDSARALAKDPVAVELAIWFHDAVYDPRAADNEECSAELAKCSVSQAGGTRQLGESVAALVLATKTHDPALHPDAPLIVDVDLSIFGQPKQRFQEYEHQIRKEYTWVPAIIFAAKRAEILERFLGRENIYSTKYFISKYQQRARSNLQESIRNLRNES